MKRIAIYTKNYFEKWRDYLVDYEIISIDSNKEFKNIKNSLVIISTCKELEEDEEVVEYLLKNSNKILILESNPKLVNAQNWLLLGVHGYGNSLMSEIHLKSSIEAISSGLIWLTPNITTEILKSLKIDSTNSESEILDKLSKAEKQVALLLKNGYTNAKISEELKLSINTVKTHIKNIYFKLDVSDKFSFINLLNKKTNFIL